MNLKIGGSNVGKIMYNGQEFGGATKLEPGTILYLSNSWETDAKNVHLLNTTKNWSNFNGINVILHKFRVFDSITSVNITGNNFKNLNKKKTYKMNPDYTPITVSRSIVDGEYRLNISITANDWVFEIRAL